MIFINAKPHWLKHAAGGIVQAYSDFSNKKPRDLLRYELAAGTSFFGGALPQLDAAADAPMALSIAVKRPLETS